MAFGLAVHGERCGAKTYPTRCRHCGNKVFYFECRCGSKVFFADLGNDWPEHRCMQMLVATYGRDFVERGMARQMQKHVASNLRTPIEKRYEDAVRRHLSRRKPSTKNWTKRVEATAGGVVSDTAVVRDVHRNVDVFTKLRINRHSQIARAMLGRLGNGKYGQVTFHCGDLYGSSIESYTVFIESKTIDKLELEDGDLVKIAVRAAKVDAKRFVWLCDEIDFTPKDFRPELS